MIAKELSHRLHSWGQISLGMLLCLLLAGALIGSPSEAQQTSPPAQQPSEPAQPPRPEASNPKTKSKEEQEIERKEQSQRVLGVVPFFGVTSRQNASPLTPGEKFHLFYKSAFDPATISIVGVQAAISQAENEFPAYGQGAEGYAKRTLTECRKLVQIGRAHV